MFLLNTERYHLTFRKMQTKPDRMKECNIDIRTLHKVCESLIHNNPVKVELQ